MCQHCQKRAASVHYTHIVNNKKKEMYLCELCANEKNQMNFISPLNVNNLFSGFMGANSMVPYTSSVPGGVVCKKCGMSYEEFQKAGKLGCSGCYGIFGERLAPVLKRLHGNTCHSGKVPARVSKSLKTSEEVKKLKGMLDNAVKNEEYEKAAEIRDKIKAIENGHI